MKTWKSRDKELRRLLAADNAFWKEHEEFQRAFREYLLKHNMKYNTNFVYKSGIDCVFIFLEDNPIFVVSLPPLSNYTIDETEHTDQYMKTTNRSEPLPEPDPVQRKEELIAV